ncbi:MAG: hypothetical protein AAF578_02710 [Pseudomonadota bacterium]
MNSLARIRALVAVGIVCLLTGCVAPPQEPIALDSRGLLVENARVGLKFQIGDEASLQMPGADCLLCLAAAAAANGALSDHAKTLDLADLASLESELINTLQSQGVNAVLIDDETEISKLPKFKGAEENSAERDYREFASKNEIDQLLVVNIGHAGILRPYSGYIATAAPSAVVRGAAFLVDSATNTYSWYLPISNFLEADGEWKEAPDYPGLTNAYYQVVEQARDDILGPMSDLQASARPRPVIDETATDETEAQ